VKVKREKKKARREERQVDAGAAATVAKDSRWKHEGLWWDREWLSRAVPDHYRYVPQMGDAVVFFPKAYATHLQKLDSSDGSTVTNKVTELPWPAIECQISDLDYSFPPSQEAYELCSSVVCSITLTVTGLPAPVEEGMNGTWFRSFTPVLESQALEAPEAFEVQLRYCPSLPDFLVLSERFIQAMKHDWQVGMRVGLLEATQVSNHPAGSAMLLSDHAVVRLSAKVVVVVVAMVILSMAVVLVIHIPMVLFAV